MQEPFISGWLNWFVFLWLPALLHRGPMGLSGTGQWQTHSCSDGFVDQANGLPDYCSGSGTGELQLLQAVYSATRLCWCLTFCSVTKICNLQNSVPSFAWACKIGPMQCSSFKQTFYTTEAAWCLKPLKQLHEVFFVYITGYMVCDVQIKSKIKQREPKEAQNTVFTWCLYWSRAVIQHQMYLCEKVFVTEFTKLLQWIFSSAALNTPRPVSVSAPPRLPYLNISLPWAWLISQTGSVIFSGSDWLTNTLSGFQSRKERVQFQRQTTSPNV